jgi:hypothetical protein
MSGIVNLIGSVFNGIVNIVKSGGAAILGGVLKPLLGDRVTNMLVGAATAWAGGGPLGVVAALFNQLTSKPGESERAGRQAIANSKGMTISKENQEMMNKIQLDLRHVLKGNEATSDAKGSWSNEFVERQLRREHY